MARLVLPNLSYKVCGVLYKIHRDLGWNCKEKIYHSVIATTLAKVGLEFRAEQPIVLLSSGNSPFKYYLDFVVESLLILEVKATRQFFSVSFIDQVLSYLKTSNLPLALVVNFRTTRLKPVRVLNPDLKDSDFSQFDTRFSRSIGPFVKIS